MLWLRRWLQLRRRIRYLGGWYSLLWLLDTTLGVPLLQTGYQALDLGFVVGLEEPTLLLRLVSEQAHTEGEVVSFWAAEQHESCCIAGSVLWRN